MNLKPELDNLIKRYENHLLSGLTIENNMRLTNSPKLEIQENINKFWRIVLQDLTRIVDKDKHDTKNRN